MREKSLGQVMSAGRRLDHRAGKPSGPHYKANGGR
jgi:hypothetical protein